MGDSACRSGERNKSEVRAAEQAEENAVCNEEEKSQGGEEDKGHQGLVVNRTDEYWAMNNKGTLESGRGGGR